MTSGPDENEHDHTDGVEAEEGDINHEAADVAHEHPFALFPERIFDERLPATLAAAEDRCAQTIRDGHDDLTYLSGRLLQAFEWLASTTAAIAFGDRQSAETYVSILSELPPASHRERTGSWPPLQPTRSRHDLTSSPATHTENHGHEEIGIRAAGPPSMHGIINMAPLVDLFIGIAISHGDDDNGRAAAAETAALHLRRNLTSHLIAYRSSELALMSGDPLDLQRHVLVVDSLRRWLGSPIDPTEDPGLPAIVAPLWSSEEEFCIAELLDALSGSGSANPVSQKIEHDLDRDNSARIMKVEPKSICVGKVLTLSSSSSDPFDDPLPSSVVFSPCVVGQLIDRSATQLHVKVPPGATDGPVRFLNMEPLALDFSYVDRLSQIADGCPMFAFAAPNTLVGLLSKAPQIICPNFALPDGRNELEAIWQAPHVDAFTMTPDIVEWDHHYANAGSTIALQWKVASDHPQGLEVVIEASIADFGVVLAENEVLDVTERRTGLPAEGSAQFVITEDTVYRLRATDACGEATRSIDVGVRRSISFEPKVLNLGPGEAAQLRIHLSSALKEDLTVSLHSDSANVSVPESVTIPHPFNDSFASVVGNAPGVPGGKGTPTPPAATITASPGKSKGTISADDEVAVWVENPAGSWQAGPDVGMLAVHAALLPTGDVLFFSSDEDDYNAIEKGAACRWTPNTDAITPVHLGRNLFCSGHCQFGDGRLLVAGGHAFSWLFGAGHGAFFAGKGADHDVHVYDSAPGTWAKWIDMAAARWYPTCVTMPDGRALVLSGAEFGAPGKPFYKGSPSNWLGARMNRRAEAVLPTGQIVVDTGHFLDDWDLDLYPFLFVLPGGVLFLHSRRKTWLYYPGTTAGGALRREASPHTYLTNSLNRRTYPVQSASVLLPLRMAEPHIARILVLGGGDESLTHSTHDTLATATAEIFDYDSRMPSGSAQSGWRMIAPMAARRFMSDAILLLDGTVIVVGGAAKGIADDNAVAVQSVQRFFPSNETWDSLASSTRERRYHSTALLLPDGRVVSAGGTGAWPPSRDHHGVRQYSRQLEVFSPPYLFRGPRPLIVSAPRDIRYGWTIRLTVSYGKYEDRGPAGARAVDEVQSVALVRLSSVTHSVNTDQRYMELIIAARDQNGIDVDLPADAAFAPPGYYLLVVVSNRGVPSEGHYLRLTA